MSALIGYCPTYGRAHLLARAIACWEQQTFSDRWLICVDDSGELDSQHSDQGKWEIVSLPRRCRSLSEKNNLCISLAPRNALYLQKHDDDDCVYPWACEAAVEALGRGEIAQPRRAIDWIDGEWCVTPTHGPGQSSVQAKFAYHGTWAMRFSFFERMRGYAPTLYSGDDGEIDDRRREMKIPSVGLRAHYGDGHGLYYRYFANYFRAHPEELKGAPGPISQRGPSADAYWDIPKPEYIGRLPDYSGDPIWNWPIPTKVLAQRPW